MAIFKISKGSKNNLPATLIEGHCWYTIEDSKFYIDFKDANGELVRKALSAENAETLCGMTLDELREEITNENIVFLYEAQAYADSLATNYATAEQGRKADTAVQTINGIAADENGNVDVETGVTSWNDLTDKPFYEIPPAFDFTWNGDMTGHETLMLEEGVYVVKVSDEVFTKEQLIGATLCWNDGYEEILAEDDIFENSELGSIEAPDIFVITSATDFINGAGLPEGSISNGVWFINVVGEEGYYVNRFVASSTLKTIDNKFLDLDGYAKTDDLDGYAKTDDLTAVAKSGSWNDLEDKPFGETIDYSKLIYSQMSMFKFTETANRRYWGSADAQGLFLTAGKHYRASVSYMGATNYIVFEGMAQSYQEMGDFGTRIISGDGELWCSLLSKILTIHFVPQREGFESVAQSELLMVSIWEGAESINTLDEKYIPDTIARTSYVDDAIANIEVSGGGKDGISATHSWNGTILTITSASGTSSADLQGPKPVKGTDYFTNADKNEIVSAVLAALPAAEGGTF